MKKKQSQSRMFGLAALAVLVLAVGLMIFGLSKTVSGMEDAMISKTPEAILASAGVTSEKDIFLSVNYFDQKADECVNLYDGDKNALKTRQFEWTECKYYKKGLEQGLVEFDLSGNSLLVGKAGKNIANQGMNDLTRWFEEVDGKSKNYIGSLQLEYNSEGAEFLFYRDDFYPLDEAEFSVGDNVNRDGHNHLFTMNFAVPFTVLANGEETFKVTADDDTFVFVDDKLVLDMGGIHDAMVGEFTIHDNGEIYASVDGEDFAYTGVTVEANSAQSIKVFHADRDSDGSAFGVQTNNMNLAVTDAKLANRQGDGLQIAYDPTDSTYVAPLGESLVTTPDNTKNYITMAIIESVLIIAFVIMLMIAVRSFVKREVKK
jgi:fibro-slime domain-containing protein